MNVAPFLIALQTLYLIEKHKREEDEDYYDDNDD